MATDIGAEGVLPPITNEPPKATPKEQIAQPTAEEAKKPGLLKRWLSSLGKKKEITQTTPIQGQQAAQETIEDRRTIVNNMPTKHMVRTLEDSNRELTYLNTISSLTELKPEELHRKAILIAEKEQQPLTEAYVAEVEQRLKAELAAKATQAASPEPVGSETKQ